jgi:hypothetical protein
MVTETTLSTHWNFEIQKEIKRKPYLFLSFIFFKRKYLFIFKIITIFVELTLSKYHYDESERSV